MSNDIIKATKRARSTIQKMFDDELRRLLSSGAIGANTSAGTVIAVITQNIADQWSHSKNNAEYKNLRKF